LGSSDFNKFWTRAFAGVTLHKTFYEIIKIGGMRNVMLSQFVVSIGPGRPSHPPWKAYFAAENTLLR
jgi:hypothetical protein